jgi:predicted ArsR family transcriptional regulator
METPELNSSQRAILDLLKHHGSMTVPRLANVLDLNVETVRGHVNGLVHKDLVRREDAIRDGPGRPEIVFGLTADAERLFPRREADILRRLADYLRRTDHQSVLDGFFDEWIAGHRDAAMARVEHLSGRERLDEVAAILSELGFMAAVDVPDGVDAAAGDAGARLRLCHCPLRGLVEVTKMPCRAEIGLVQELVGRQLSRESYIPAGDASCSYRLSVGSAVDPD